MVEVTLWASCPAGEESTFGMEELDESLLCGAGSSFGGDQVEQLVEMTYSHPPFGLGGISYQLAGHIGDDRSPAGYLSGVVV
jgi:hypothetical protein